MIVVLVLGLSLSACGRAASGDSGSETTSTELEDALSEAADSWESPMPTSSYSDGYDIATADGYTYRFDYTIEPDTYYLIDTNSEDPELVDVAAGPIGSHATITNTTPNETALLPDVRVCPMYTRTNYDAIADTEDFGTDHWLSYGPLSPAAKGETILSESTDNLTEQFIAPAGEVLTMCDSFSLEEDDSALIPIVGGQELAVGGSHTYTESVPKRFTINASAVENLLDVSGWFVAAGVRYSKDMTLVFGEASCFTAGDYCRLGSAMPHMPVTKP